MSKIFQRPQRAADPAPNDPFRRPLILGGVLLVIWLAVSLMPETERKGPPPTNPVSTAAMPAASVAQTKSASEPSLIRPGYIVALILLAGGSYWAWRLKQKTQATGSDPLLRELGRLRTGPNQEIQLIACGPDVLLLGATPQQITLLRQYPAETLLAAAKSAPNDEAAEETLSETESDTAPQARPAASEFMHVLRRYNDPRHFRSNSIYPRQTAESFVMIQRLPLLARRLALMGLLALLSAGPLLARQSASSPAPLQMTGQQTAQQTAQPPAAGSLSNLPTIQLGDGEEGYALPIQLLLLLTVLSLAPAIVILMTSFTRLIVVLGILRQALGTAQSPPTQVLVGLSLFLTLFIMYPVFDQVHEQAVEPYMAGTLSQEDALSVAVMPMKRFMLAQTREKDLLLFVEMAQIEQLDTPDDTPLHVLVPAYVISELRIAFQIGFMIYLPFLIVDLIVASVLMSLGMMMLPPMMISLPVKLLLFVLADGWFLIVQSVVQAYLGS